MIKDVGMILELDVKNTSISTPFKATVSRTKQFGGTSRPKVLKPLEVVLILPMFKSNEAHTDKKSPKLLDSD